LKKVAWPDKDELTGATSVVIVTVLLLAIYIGIWDFPLARFVRVLIR
jgi:preprotein translocase SecE subunit